MPRTDTPRGGTIRVTFDAVVTGWDREFTGTGRRRIGASLPAAVFVRAERRVTPLQIEFGVTDRIALSARVPLVRAMTRGHVVQDSAGTGAALDSTLADSAYLLAPIADTRRGLRYFPGDAELAAKVRVVAGPGPYAAAAEVVVRLPTGHLDSPNNLFDLATGDDQTDLELRFTQELTVARRLWLNVSVRGIAQRPGTRERRVAPQSALLTPRAALATLAWDPGDALALDVAPMLRLGGSLGVGVTAGYYTKRRDRYRFQSAADSVALATRLGAPRSASVLDAGTAARWTRLGVAVSYVGPYGEGGLSIEQTVTAAGGPEAMIPAATVLRIVVRASRWPF